MIYCKKCGASLDENYRFCPKCGHTITFEMDEINPGFQTRTQPIHSQTPPENYLVWAILSTIFCCWPFGIPAIINATKVDSAFNRGDYAGAKEYSRKAKKWTITSAIIAGVFWLVYIILMVVYVIVMGGFLL